VLLILQLAQAAAQVAAVEVVLHLLREQAERLVQVALMEQTGHPRVLLYQAEKVETLGDLLVV
jgi:hypothetical protein